MDDYPPRPERRGPLDVPEMPPGKGRGVADFYHQVVAVARIGSTHLAVAVLQQKPRLVGLARVLELEPDDHAVPGQGIAVQEDGAP